LLQSAKYLKRRERTKCGEKEVYKGKARGKKADAEATRQ